MDPEKIGGYGYLNYVDKMAYKRGFSIDDTNMERLNKTFYERNRDSPKKMNSTRTTHVAGRTTTFSMKPRHNNTYT